MNTYAYRTFGRLLPKTIFTIVSGVLAFLIVGSSPTANAVTAYEPPPGGWLQNSLSFSSTSEYFTTKANYGDHRGDYTRLPIDGSSFTTFESRLRARYNLNQRFSFFGGGAFTYSRAADNLNDKTNSNVSDLFFGADFLLNKKYVHLIPELSLGFPVATTDREQTKPLTGDGVAYARAGMFFYHPFRNFRIGGYTGVHLPADGLAKRFLYEVTADARLAGMFTFGGGVDGYETIINDERTYAERARTATLANAGSQRYFAFDPALFEARAWLGFRPDNSLWIRLGYAKTLLGLYTAEGQSFLLSIAYNTGRLDGGAPPDNFTTRGTAPTLPGTSPQPPPQPPRKRPDQDHAQRTFEADVENTEQGIFDMEAKEQPRNPLDTTEKMLEKKNQDKQQ